MVIEHEAHKAREYWSHLRPVTNGYYDTIEMKQRAAFARNQQTPSLLKWIGLRYNYSATRDRTKNESFVFYAKNNDKRVSSILNLYPN